LKKGKKFGEKAGRKPLTGKCKGGGESKKEERKRVLQ